MTPQAQEAFTVAESNWYEANGIEPDPDTEAHEHKLAQDMWAAALQWQQERLAVLHASDDEQSPFCNECGHSWPCATLRNTPSPEGN